MKTFLIILALLGIGIIIWNSPWGRRQRGYIYLGARIRMNNQNIALAKKELEQEIIDRDYVSSVGTRKFEDTPEGNAEVIKWGSEQYIEVGVISKDYISEIEKILNNGWNGFPVKIVVKPYSTPQ